MLEKNQHLFTIWKGAKMPPSQRTCWLGELPRILIRLSVSFAAWLRSVHLTSWSLVGWQLPCPPWEIGFSFMQYLWKLLRKAHWLVLYYSSIWVAVIFPGKVLPAGNGCIQSWWFTLDTCVARIRSFSFSSETIYKRLSPLFSTL